MEPSDFVLELQHESARGLVPDPGNRRQLFDIFRLDCRDQIGHWKGRQYAERQFGSDPGHAGQQHKSLFLLRREKSEELNCIFTDVGVNAQRGILTKIR